MKSKRLFVAIGNIDERFIDEDAEEITNLKHRPQKRTATFSPWLKFATPLAACLIIAVAIFGLPNLFTNPIAPPVVIPPIDTSPSQPIESNKPHEPTQTENPPEIIEPGSMLVFTNAYESLLDLHNLLKQSDESIEEYLNNHSDYSMNRLLTRADIESLFALIDKSQFPFMEGVRVDEVLVVSEAERVYSRFVVDGIVYGFTSMLTERVQDIIPIEEADGRIELLHTMDNISLYYLKSHDDPNDDLLPFIMDVRGVYVHVLVKGANDLQTAIDGISAFGFGSLILE